MERIRDILGSLHPELKDEYLTSENYIEDALIDSFDLIVLVAELEKAYNISIKGIDILPENFQNLASIENFLRTYGVEG